MEEAEKFASFYFNSDGPQIPRPVRRNEVIEDNTNYDEIDRL